MIKIQANKKLANVLEINAIFSWFNLSKNIILKRDYNDKSGRFLWK